MLASTTMMTAMALAWFPTTYSLAGKLFVVSAFSLMGCIGVCAESMRRQYEQDLQQRKDGN
jgi:hypothetical protein